MRNSMEGDRTGEFPKGPPPGEGGENLEPTPEELKRRADELAKKYLGRKDREPERAGQEVASPSPTKPTDESPVDIAEKRRRIREAYARLHRDLEPGEKLSDALKEQSEQAEKKLGLFDSSKGGQAELLAHIDMVEHSGKVITNERGQQYTVDDLREMVGRIPIIAKSYAESFMAGRRPDAEAMAQTMGRATRAEGFRKAMARAIEAEARNLMDQADTIEIPKAS